MLIRLINLLSNFVDSKEYLFAYKLVCQPNPSNKVYTDGRSFMFRPI